MSDVLRFDLSKEPKGNPITHGRVSDSNGLVRKVKVFDDGKPFDLTGWTVTFEGNTSKYKTKVFDSEGISIVSATKGEFTYTFPNMAFAVEGQYERAYFSFTKGDQRKSTGNFEIIVFGNSDIDAPEAETIITEYNKLVAELNKLQNEAIDEMDQNFAVAQEIIVELEGQISDLRSQIEQALADFETGNFWTKEESFNKEQSSANVIYQLIGKEEAEILITADFKEKITGSVVENPNIIRFSTNSTFMPPLTGSEPGQVHYDQTMTKDGVTLNVGNTKSDYMSQIQPNWNLVEIVDRTIPELFETLGLTDDSEKIEFIKKSVSSLRNSVDGVGTGLRRNRLTLKLYDSSGLLEAEESVNVTSQIQELVRETTDRTTIQNRISDSGFVSGLIYTEASDGVAVSQASLDYTKLQIKLKVSANLLIKLTIAHYHRENIGNVDNYGTATQAEAEAGSASDKFMTPLRTKQHVDSRMADVSEVIAGQSSDKIVSPKALKEASIIPIKISEWMNVPLVSTAEAADNTTPQYRIITFSSGENTRTKVEFRGAVRSSSTHNIPSSNYSFNVSKLPSDIRPSQTVLVPCGTGHMSFTARGAVTPAGDLLLGNQSGVSFDYAYLDSLTYWLD